MSPRLVNARHPDNFRIELTFNDGSVPELDLAEHILNRGEVFRLLEDIALFKRVQVDVEAGTIVWPNGVDFCPDVLYALATGKPIKSLEPAWRFAGTR